MRYWRIYLAVVLVLAVFSLRCTAANETKFVNNTKSKLKILGIFGHLGKSHFDVFKPLLEELARQGHDITVLSYFPRSDNAKAKEKLSTYRDISLVNSDINVFVNVVDLHEIRHSTSRILKEFLMLRYMADVACNSTLKHPAVKKLIQSNNEKFDVILTENFNTDCFLGFVHKFKAPFIYLSSHQIMPWVNDEMGNEDNPSYIPVIFLGLTTPMDFFSKMMNTLTMLIVKVFYNYWFRPIDQVYANEAFGPNLPNLKNIAKQSKALLVNTHSSLHGSRPHLPNVVEIGGLHIPSKINPLPQDVKEYLDNAHEGVLYFSFGSMIKATTMPQEKLDAILNVIGSIPRKVLWKWESEELPRKMDNVMVKKWMPQFDVLSK